MKYSKKIYWKTIDMRAFWDVSHEGQNKDGIEVLKLHGSISWMEVRSCKKYSLEFRSEGEKCWKLTRYTRFEKELELHPQDASLIKNPSNKSEAFTPVIIPFYRQKKEWYTQLWRKIFVPIYKRCVTVINESSEIIVVGYGLPEADWTITELFTACDKKKKQVTVVMPPKNACCNNTHCCCKYSAHSEQSPRPESVDKYEKLFGNETVKPIYKCFKAYMEDAGLDC